MRLQNAMLIVAASAFIATAAIGRWAIGVVLIVAVIVLPILAIQMVREARDYRRVMKAQLSGNRRVLPKTALVWIIWGVGALVALAAGTLYAIVRVQTTLQH
jgi:hypothetical protein